MSHLVIYRGADGSPGYHQTDEVHDAVSFVERLRNEQGVEGAQIYRMEQVNFEYRPYFRVELTGGDASLGAVPTHAAVGSATSSQAPVVEEVAEVDVSRGEDRTASAAADSEPEPASSTVRSISDAPTVSVSSDGDNGVGARRGLFGR